MKDETENAQVCFILHPSSFRRRRAGVMSNWPFPDAQDSKALTLVQILTASRPVLVVTHDADDGTWQFLDGGNDLKGADARLAPLRVLLNLDPTLAEVADLPLGWVAWRGTVGAAWQRGPMDKESAEGEDEEDDKPATDAGPAERSEPC
jgi:hypothetical protein